MRIFDWGRAVVVMACFAPSLFSMEASFSCRVKTDVLKKYASLTNNSGCLITRKKDSAYEVLLVQSARSDGGLLAFPGGTPAMKSADQKERSNRRFAQAVAFDYHEPSVCTAARETKEETGYDVIVADLVDESKYFNLYRCELVFEGRSTIDHSEVEKVEWFNLQRLIAQHEAGQKIFRFESNYQILKEWLTAQGAQPKISPKR